MGEFETWDYDLSILSGHTEIVSQGHAGKRKAPRVGFLTAGSKPKKPAKRKGTTARYERRHR